MNDKFMICNRATECEEKNCVHRSPHYSGEACAEMDCLLTGMSSVACVLFSTDTQQQVDTDSATIRKAFAKMYGEIGETYNEDEWLIRLGIYVSGWIDALHGAGRVKQ